MITIHLHDLDRHELLERLRRCVADDRRSTARLLEHMAEVDARGLYRDEAYASMFDYCVRALHMSEAEAALRIRAARFCRLYPMAMAMLGRGELHLTAIGLLAPVMKAGHTDLLREAAFKSKREVESLLARHFPQPDVPSGIRKLPDAAATPRMCTLSLVENDGGGGLALAAGAQDAVSRVPDTMATSTDDVSASRADGIDDAPEVVEGVVAVLVDQPTVRGAKASPSHAGSASATSGARHLQCEAAASAEADRIPLTQAQPLQAAATQRAAPAPLPLSDGRFKVQFTASQSLRDKLVQAQHLSRHLVPGGDLAAIIERALDLFIAERRKALFGQTSKPRDRQAAVRNRAPLTPRAALVTHEGGARPASQSQIGARASSTTERSSEPAAAQPTPARLAPQPPTTPAPGDPGAPPLLPRHSDFDEAASMLQAQHTTYESAASGRGANPVGDSAPMSAHVAQASATERPLNGANTEPAVRAPEATSARADRSTSSSRHIPNRVKRQVAARDGERCSIVASDGQRCRERGRLEFHHDRPFACGGEATVENIWLLCKSHNLLLAERDFGRAFMVNAVTTKQRPDATRERDLATQDRS